MVIKYQAKLVLIKFVLRKKNKCSICRKYFHKNCASNYTKGNIDQQNWVSDICDQEIIIKKNISSKKHDFNKNTEQSKSEEINIKVIQNNTVNEKNC